MLPIGHYIFKRVKIATQADVPRLSRINISPYVNMPNERNLLRQCLDTALKPIVNFILACGVKDSMN